MLILSTHLRHCLPSNLFPSGFPTNILYTFLFGPMSATGPSHLILIIIIVLGEEYNLESPQYAAFSNLPSLHFSLVQIFSSALCLCSSLNVRDHTAPQENL
jgi:hypothetical protein